MIKSRQIQCEHFICAKINFYKSRYRDARIGWKVNADLSWAKIIIVRFRKVGARVSEKSGSPLKPGHMAVWYR